MRRLPLRELVASSKGHKDYENRLKRTDLQYKGIKPEVKIAGDKSSAKLLEGRCFFCKLGTHKEREVRQLLEKHCLIVQ